MECLLEEKHLTYYNQDLFAKVGIQTLFDVAQRDSDIFKNLFLTKSSLLKKYSNNIVLDNSIDIFLSNLTLKNIREETKIKKNFLFKNLEKSNKDQAKLASKKIKQNSTIFLHSINNQIVELIKQASKYKTFSINVVEHQPYNIGNILKKKFKQNNINVFSDLNMIDAIEHSDICFLGGEVVTHKGDAISKTGSTMVSKIAQEFHIPLYVCAHSFKFDSKNKNMQILNNNSENIKNYDFISSKNISSFIIEHGIFSSDHIVSEIKYFNKFT